MKDSKNLFKKLGLIGIGLCAICCLLPLAAVMFGLGALTVISAYLEWAGILAMTSAAVFFVIYYVKKQQAPACDIDCGCKEENAAIGKD
jgi:hypothetical protein